MLGTTEEITGSTGLFADLLWIPERHAGMQMTKKKVCDGEKENARDVKATITKRKEGQVGPPFCEAGERKLRL